ncbi:unnamed protein product, partial [Symbiodinium microadriaticum]
MLPELNSWLEETCAGLPSCAVFFQLASVTGGGDSVVITAISTWLWKAWGLESWTRGGAPGACSEQAPSSSSSSGLSSSSSWHKEAEDLGEEKANSRLCQLMGDVRDKDLGEISALEAALGHGSDANLVVEGSSSSVSGCGSSNASASPGQMVHVSAPTLCCGNLSWAGDAFLSTPAPMPGASALSAHISGVQMRRSPCGLSRSAFALAVVTGLLHFEAAAYTPLVSPGTGVPHYLGVPAGKLLRKHQPPRVLDHRQKHAVAIDGHANLVDVGRSFNLGRPESLAAQEPEAEAAAAEAPAEEAPAEEGAEAASGEGEAATETAAEEGAEASADATEGAAAGGSEGAKDDAAEGAAEGASGAAAEGGASEAATEATAEGSVAASGEGATAGAAAAPAAAAAAGAVVEGSVAGTTGAATTAAATTVAAVAAAATTAVPTTVALAAGKAQHHKVKAVAPAAKGTGAAKGTKAAASNGTPGAGLPWKGIILVLSIVALVVFLGPKLYEMATAKPPLPGRLNEIKSEPSDQQVWASSKARQTYRKSVLAAQSNKSSSDSEDAAAKPAPRGSAASAGSREAAKAPAAAAVKEKEAKEGNGKEAKDVGGTASREEAPRASTSSRQRSPSASSGSYRARRTAANKSSGNWPGLRCRNTEDSPYRCLMEVEQRHLAAARKDPATGLPICGTCARLGHPLCGLRYWITLRAAWLRLPEELVAEEPHSFEDPGSVQIARQAQIGFVREISEGEAEDLEDCLDAIQRPFPLLRRPIPLSQ